MNDRLLIIGRTDGLRPAMDSVLRDVKNIRVFHTIEEALAAGPIPEPLVLVCEYWPDEYSPPQIHQLLAAIPLARLIVAQGPWCASAGRTRRNWPAAVCVPWERTSDRLERERDVLAGLRPPLPWTAGMDEIFSFDHTSPRRLIRSVDA